MARSPARIARLGRVDYVDTATLQRSLRAAREANATDDLLLMLEHDSVITCGRVTEAADIAYARTTDLPIVPVERGGKATYHGPHQVVAYPIFALTLVDGDVKELVHRIEQATIDALEAVRVTSSRRSGYPGVWVDVETEHPRKIGSLGLRLTGGVTFHGVAVNVANDLTPFGWFTPCGIPDADMTSVARELDLDPAGDLAARDEAAAEQLAAQFAQLLETHLIAQFDLASTDITTGELHALAARFPVEPPALRLPDAEAAPAPTSNRIDLTVSA
jgi:lipoyl(octanoyl) transferase